MLPRRVASREQVGRDLIVYWGFQVVGVMSGRGVTKNVCRSVACTAFALTALECVAA